MYQGYITVAEKHRKTGCEEADAWPTRAVVAKMPGNADFAGRGKMREEGTKKGPGTFCAKHSSDS